MNTSRIALTASGAAAILWAAKAVAIDIAGGLGRSPFEGPLFFLGFAAILVAVVSLGLTLSAGRSRLVRGLTGAACILAAVLVSVLAGAVVALVRPAHPGWAWEEVNLWVLALATLAMAGWGLLRTTPARSS
jgi:hypothetical protein